MQIQGWKKLSSADPFVEVTPPPRLAGFEAAHHRMQRLAEVP
jgi:hypothetical protein